MNIYNLSAQDARFYLDRTKENMNGKMKGILGGIIAIVVLFIVIGKAVPALWPSFIGSGTDVAALTQTDAATTTLQDFWPIALLVVGIGIAVGLIFAAIKHFKIG